jgi:hypothetical protein
MMLNSDWLMTTSELFQHHFSTFSAFLMEIWCGDAALSPLWQILQELCLSFVSIMKHLFYKKVEKPYF